MHPQHAGPSQQLAAQRITERLVSKIARALILAVMVAVLPLAGLTIAAYAQASDQDTPSQQELAERWNTDYYQATHMSPAQHKAWLQAYKNSGSATQAPAPVPPTEPNGQPTWLVVSLGGLAAGLAVVAGLALLAARRANRRAQVGHAT
jgi:Na+(H+)/acetate symporter ActP